MNIDDVKTVEKIPNDQVFVAIAKHQLELAIKYGPIEERNGFYHPDPLNPPPIDDRRFQSWIKDMFWRTTEEIAEALEPLDRDIPPNWRDQWNELPHVRHVYEEFSDALHFLTEVTVVCLGLDAATRMIDELSADARRVQTFEKLHSLTIRCVSFFIVENLGLAANCLKNKPWKLTHMPTDVHKFAARLSCAWSSFMVLWQLLDCTRQDIWQLYAKKNAVNQFRQKTNY